jgi:hypothetical protein
MSTVSPLGSRVRTTDAGSIAGSSAGVVTCDGAVGQAWVSETLSVAMDSQQKACQAASATLPVRQGFVVSGEFPVVGGTVPGAAGVQLLHAPGPARVRKFAASVGRPSRINTQPR